MYIENMRLFLIKLYSMNRKESRVMAKTKENSKRNYVEVYHDFLGNSFLTHIDDFHFDDDIITQKTRPLTRKSRTEPTDELTRTSKYLNTIFAYKNIPLTLVPISLLMAQEMEFKTNRIYLLKPVKEDFAHMLDISLDRVNKLIKECRKYDIIRPIARGIYEVNSYLYSTGSVVETRNLQAHFDFTHDTFMTQAEQKNLITGSVVQKAVINKNEKNIL